MTRPDLEPIAHLDWKPEITCECTHHDGGVCHNRATHVVEIHAIGRCWDNGLTAAGNRIEIRCAACVMALQAEVRYKLDKLNEYGLFICGSCPHSVEEVSDVIRSVTEL